ncbi:MAG TPA: hypothetical protein VKS79_15125 [Gemmataceae bacterium]|nr:hypothetical protein [Gemmataceae bacterium]
MLRLIGEALRIVAIPGSLLMTLLWCIIAFVVYPWLVLADSVGTTGAYEEASLVALGLAIVSAVGFLLAGGAFGKCRPRWIVGAALIAGHAVAACRLELYRPPLEDRAFLFLSCQVVSIVLIIVGTASGVAEPGRKGASVNS